MKAQLRILSLLGAVAIAAPAMTMQLLAQDNPNHRERQYIPIQAGTFGGTDSQIAAQTVPSLLRLEAPI